MRPSMQRLRRALTELAGRIYPESLLLRDLRMLALGSGIEPQEMPIPTSETGTWVAAHPGTRWGGYDQTAWFHGTAQVPASWLSQREGGERIVVLRMLLGSGTEFGWPEGLLYVNRRLQQGINRHHPDVLLRVEDVQTGSLVIDVRGWSGILPDDHRLATSEIALLDRPTERLFHLLTAGVDLVDALDECDPLIFALASALNAAYDAVELTSPTFYNSVRVAVRQLESELQRLRASHTPTSRPIVTAVGHGHLDVAWLWQTRHTREKTARTFAIATALMDAYPEYVFLHTTPQVFAWLEQDHPELYERVRGRVADGRFEAAGAMWVESDCNLVSGESLVRQILYGQQYLREHFGREYHTLWLPDAFGYSAALPQIMLRSGIPIFMTTKLSWSETNRIPADTFHWVGLDGSTVLAHFITTPTLGGSALFANMDTYNGQLNVAAVRGVGDRYRQKNVLGETLLAFGHGDGGAGATRQQIEHARALQTLPGMPELRLGRADEYFDRLRAAVDAAPDLPRWDGDLYLEYHRGTYTTQSWLKRTHRQLEGSLLIAEWLDAWQWATQRDTAPNRREALDAAWRTLLMHEFHDILPGSSIATVYWDAQVALERLRETLDGLIRNALAGLFAGAPRGSVVLLNSSPFARGDLVVLPDEDGQRVPMMNGRPAAVQRAAEDGSLLVEVPDVPGRGFAMLEWVDGQASTGGTVTSDADATAGTDENGIWLKNAYFTVRLNDAGEIVSLVDQREPGGRELVPNGGRANALTAYEDLPREFDAWDIDAYYTRKPYALETTQVAVEESGPLRAVVRVERRFRSSTVTQRLMLYHSNPRIDFATAIDWYEQHILLKTRFALDLRATHVTCETQYGAIERPLHRNTSWDSARFEIPAHRWIDVSEGAYGVSLLNDGRYGHDVADGALGLTLLRSPTYPDPQADQGEHEVIYSLYPHRGDWRTGGTVAAGYTLNRPMLVFPSNSGDTGDKGNEPSAPAAENTDSSAIMCATATEGVVIEAIKRSHDGSTIIVRLYEATGSRRRAEVNTALTIRDVVECDLLERPLTAEGSPAYALWHASRAASHDAPVVAGQSWTCELRPYEVRTFRVTATTRVSPSYSQSL